MHLSEGIFNVASGLCHFWRGCCLSGHHQLLKRGCFPMRLHPGQALSCITQTHSLDAPQTKKKAVAIIIKICVACAGASLQLITPQFVSVASWFCCRISFLNPLEVSPCQVRWEVYETDHTYRVTGSALQSFTDLMLDEQYTHHQMDVCVQHMVCSDWSYHHTDTFLPDCTHQAYFYISGAGKILRELLFSSVWVSSFSIKLAW